MSVWPQGVNDLCGSQIFDQAAWGESEYLRSTRVRVPPRLGAVAFIHRFGSSLNAHLHFHCVVIDGVFDAAAAGRVVFHATTWLDATAIADVQARLRRRLLRVFARR